jgi:hypothetical protein
MSGTPRDQLAQFLRDDLQRAASEAEPIDDDGLEAYVDGTLDAVECEILETRLADDAALRAEVEDLRALRQVLTPPAAAPVVPLAGHREARASLRRWVVPLGLAAAALVALLVWRPSRPAPALPPQAQAPAAPAGAPREASPPPLALALQDRDRRIGLTADSRLAGLEDVPPELAVSLTAALRDGRLPVSALGARLASPAGVLLSGDAGGGGFRPTAPVATAVLTPRPLLRWTPLPAARRYRVRIVDETLQPIAESPWLPAAAWRPASPLPAGRVLVWQVEADTADGPRITPAPPLPEARFAVLPAADAARLEAGMRAATSDLAVAVIAAEAGLYDEAAVTLARLAQDNPQAPVVAALRRDLAARRHPPR